MAIDPLETFGFQSESALGAATAMQASVKSVPGAKRAAAREHVGAAVKALTALRALVFPPPAEDDDEEPAAKAETTRTPGTVVQVENAQ